LLEFETPVSVTTVPSVNVKVPGMRKLPGSVIEVYSYAGKCSGPHAGDDDKTGRGWILEVTRRGVFDGSGVREDRPNKAGIERCSTGTGLNISGERVGYRNSGGLPRRCGN
jgi:hypothetical protein